MKKNMRDSLIAIQSKFPFRIYCMIRGLLVTQN